MPFLQKYIFPPLIAIFYWLWVHTWRFRILEHPEFKAAMQNGAVAFAHWHGDNLILVRIGRKYRCASLASTSSDGEIITRVLKIFGFGMARGSSHRGGVQGLVGMIARVKEGYNPAIAVDGPKGPRHKVKPGIIYVAKHGKIPLIPTGVAMSSALIFNEAWDKTHFPWPFSKVVVSFGAPLEPGGREEGLIQTDLECRMLAEQKLAQDKI
jgi:lysophospholipid acyltransferase (LPLAT)-like uncharacterized protein